MAHPSSIVARASTLAFLLLLLPVHAVAQGAPQPIGPEFQVNQTASGDQAHPGVAELRRGGFIATWSYYGGSGPADIRAQRFNGNDEAFGREIEVNTFTDGQQDGSAAATLSDGSVVVVWSSAKQNKFGDRRLFLQRFDDAGKPVGGETQVSDLRCGSHRDPKIATFPSGFVVVWDCTYFQKSTFHSSVAFRRFDNDGKPTGKDHFVGIEPDHREYASSVASLPNDEFVVAYVSFDIPNDRQIILVQKFNANDKEVGFEADVELQDFSDISVETSTASLGAGGFVVAWKRPRDPSIYRRQFSAASVPGPTILTGVAKGNSILRDLRSAPAPDGGLLLAWCSSGGGVFAARFSAEGAGIGGTFRVNDQDAASPYNVALAAIGDDDLIFVWEDREKRGGKNYNIYGRRFGLSD